MGRRWDMMQQRNWVRLIFFTGQGCFSMAKAILLQEHPDLSLKKKGNARPVFPQHASAILHAQFQITVREVGLFFFLLLLCFFLRPTRNTPSFCSAFCILFFLFVSFSLACPFSVSYFVGTSIMWTRLDPRGVC